MNVQFDKEGNVGFFLVRGENLTQINTFQLAKLKIV